VSLSSQHGDIITTHPNEPFTAGVGLSLYYITVFIVM